MVPPVKANSDLFSESDIALDNGGMCPGSRGVSTQLPSRRVDLDLRSAYHDRSIVVDSRIRLRSRIRDAAQLASIREAVLSDNQARGVAEILEATGDLDICAGSAS